MRLTLSESNSAGGPITEAVARRFSRAARSYDRYATVQQRVASDAIAGYCWQSDDSVLDIGAGTGANTQHIATQVASAVGVDISPGMVSESARRYPRLTFVEGDAEALPFAGGQFSVVFSSMALQWCTSPARVLNEISRILKPGGKAVLAIMVDGSFKELAQAQRVAQRQGTLMPIAPADNWLQHCHASALAILRSEQRSYTGEFGDMLALLRSISRVGASTTQHAGRPMTRQDIHALAAAYRPMATAAGLLPLTYQLLHMQLEKR